VAIFGTADYPYHCQCQRLKVTGWLWRDTTLEERLAMHRASTACGQPGAEHTSGLVAYLGDDPVGWVAVEPRITYPKLRTLRVPWTGREDKDDEGVGGDLLLRPQGLPRRASPPLGAGRRHRGARAAASRGTMADPAGDHPGEVHVGRCRSSRPGSSRSALTRAGG
jgi:hypothetical protein